MKSKKPYDQGRVISSGARLDSFAEEYPYPILQLNPLGEVLYANSASLPVLLEWNLEIGDVAGSGILEVVNQVFKENTALKVDVQHGQMSIELTFSTSLDGSIINVFGQDVTIQRMLQSELLESKKIAFQVRDEAQNAQKSLEKAEIIGKYGSWELDLLTREMKWSNGLFSVFGYALGEVSPSFAAFLDLVNPSNHAQIHADLEASVQDPSREMRTEYTITRRDQVTRHMRGVGQVILNEKGVPIKILGTTQDVTDLVLAQEEARFYKTALDQTSIVAITDKNGVLTHVNENFCRISKYEKHELMGKTHQILNSGVMESGFFNSMWKTISSGHLWSGEICNRSKDGQFYWVETSIIPFMDTHGVPERYVAIRTDITQRKSIEGELVRTKELALDAFQRLEEAEKIARLGSWEWGLKDRSFRCSKGFISIFQWHENFTPTYDSFMKCLLPEDRKTFEPAIESSLHSQEAFACNYRVRLETGEVKWLRSEGLAVYDGTGKPTKIIGTVQDITEKVQVEMELMEATLKADSAIRTKAEFLANMSHEIRTPMNGVIGMCNLLLCVVTDSTQLEQLKIIQNCGNSLLNLINDILDLSKLEAGKIELENEPFNIHDTVHEIIQLLSVKALESRTQLSYQADATTPLWVLGDTTRFRQVLTNLVSNALKFTENGAVAINSSAQKLDDGRFKIQFSVKDTGIGIPEGARDKLFNAFSQADVSTTRKYGGTGLGLRISKELCEKMGGKIWFKSEEGKGSVFSFTMILSEVQTEKVVQSSSPISSIDPEMGKKFPLRILIAEDNRVNQLVAVGLLEKLGYLPDVASNGLEVLDSIERKTYDLIFMDYHMPEMDGLEATKRIMERYPEETRPYIVALTASAMKGDVDRCFAAGMKDFISKPIQVKEINRILTSRIDRVSKN